MENYCDKLELESGLIGVKLELEPAALFDTQNLAHLSPQPIHMAFTKSIFLAYIKLQSNSDIKTSSPQFCPPAQG